MTILFYTRTRVVAKEVLTEEALKGLTREKIARIVKKVERILPKTT